MLDGEAAHRDGSLAALVLVLGARDEVRLNELRGGGVLGDGGLGRAVAAVDADGHVGEGGGDAREQVILVVVVPGRWRARRSQGRRGGRRMRVV